MVKNEERPVVSARGTTAKKGPVDNPLDFIAEDHMREREVCALIDKLATAAAVSTKERARILDFLIRALPEHLKDEEIDLFPMMLDRCEPEDEIEKVIKKLLSDHRHAISDAPHVATLIEAQGADDHPFAASDCREMKDFADQSRRHLILENAVILPIARARLTAADLDLMKQHMLQRRSKAKRPRTGHH